MMLSRLVGSPHITTTEQRLRIEDAWSQPDRDVLIVRPAEARTGARASLEYEGRNLDRLTFPAVVRMHLPSAARISYDARTANALCVGSNAIPLEMTQATAPEGMLVGQ